MGMPSATTGKSQYRASRGLAWLHEVGDTSGTSKCQSQPPPTQPGPACPDGMWRGARLAAEINSHDPVLSAGGYVGHLDCRALPAELVPHPPSPLWRSQFSGPCSPRNTDGGNPERCGSPGPSVSPGSPCLCSCCTLCLKSPFPSFSSSSSFFFLIFGHTPQHVGPWFPSQGWNRCPMHWKVES